MLSKKSVLAVIGILGVCSAGAWAQVNVGSPIVVESVGGGPQSVSVHYFSATTPLDGLLYLDGSSTPNGEDMALFLNHDGLLGFEHNLGNFEEGARLDFVYNVMTGVPDSFRTTDPLGSMQFRWEWSTPDIILVGVDDMRLPMGDADYDDIMFEVRFQPVPTPGLMGAMAMLGLVGFRRRR